MSSANTVEPEVGADAMDMGDNGVRTGMVEKAAERIEVTIEEVAPSKPSEYRSVLISFAYIH